MGPKFGDIYICTSAKSNFYITGKEYPLVQDEAGNLGFLGEDGLFDPMTRVISKFRPKTPKKKVKPKNE